MSDSLPTVSEQRRDVALADHVLGDARVAAALEGFAANFSRHAQSYDDITCTFDEVRSSEGAVRRVLNFRAHRHREA